MDRLLELTHRAERTHFWFRGFRRFVTPWLAAAAGARTDLVLLDCGCGTGANLALLARHGRAFGFDVTARGLQFAAAHGSRRVARASIDAIPFPDATFDVVTSFDVLYGLPDAVEQGAVREMARVLKPGGALLVTAAAFESLRGGHGTFSHEVRRYTTSSLSTLLGGAGFEVERTSYTHATLFPILAVVRGFQRWRGGGVAAASEGDLSLPAAPVNAALSAALAVEAALLPRVDLPFGSTVMALARKRR
ncbi:MAG: class I SAM-dependent methyltransferase [Vicinamibacterales bacterium]